MARKIEMHWICSSCGTRNLGRHKRCTECGDPKDASERWIMPSDTRAAPSVTDPTLLRQASAGADWQCGFCGSHQRRLDGTCGFCGATQRDGARVPRGGARPRHAPQLGQRPRPSRSTRPPPPRGGGARAQFGSASRSPGPLALVVLSLPIAGVFVIGTILLAVALSTTGSRGTKPTFAEVEVLGVRWVRTVHVERYRTVDGEGFVENRPDDAFDIRSLGQAHHHDEQVLDHYRTETYTEQVPYTDTETYMDQEACGEDCTSIPESCHEVCTPDDNGFASCHDVCSGGGERCTTRYCSVSRTRQVTRYRPEQRTREVPVYRTEPRYAERFAWRVWRWGHDRDVTRDGDDSSVPRWPTDEELAPPAPLGEGERERTEREESLTATLRPTRGGASETMDLDMFSYRMIQRYPRWYIRRGTRTELYKPAPDRI